MNTKKKSSHLESSQGDVAGITDRSISIESSTDSKAACKCKPVLVVDDNEWNLYTF